MINWSIKYRAALSGMVLAAMMLLSCAGEGGTKTDGQQVARLQHGAEINPVEVMVLGYTDFDKEFVSNGKVTAKNRSSLNFKTSGVIKQVLVRNGDNIRQGDVLALLDESDALHNYRTAGAALEKAEIDLKNTIIGFGYDADTTQVSSESLAISRIRSGYNTALLAMEEARTVLQACTLRAPFAGKVANLNGRPFEKTSEEFCTLIGDSQMTVDFKIFESELGILKKGHQVNIVSFYDPDVKAKGIVTSINPTIDEKGQILVTAEISGATSGLMDGMNVKVFAQSTLPGQLVVPKSAVVIRDNLEVLFCYSEGRAKWVYVHTLQENSHSYIVAPNIERGAELWPGDSVIISGNLNLADNSQVELKKAD